MKRDCVLICVPFLGKFGSNLRSCTTSVTSSVSTNEIETLDSIHSNRWPHLIRLFIYEFRLTPAANDVPTHKLRPLVEEGEGEAEEVLGSSSSSSSSCESSISLYCIWNYFSFIPVRSKIWYDDQYRAAIEAANFYDHPHLRDVSAAAATGRGCFRHRSRRIGHSRQLSVRDRYGKRTPSVIGPCLPLGSLTATRPISLWIHSMTDLTMSFTFTPPAFAPAAFNGDFFLLKHPKNQWQMKWKKKKRENAHKCIPFALCRVAIRYSARVKRRMLRCHRSFPPSLPSNALERFETESWPLVAVNWTLVIDESYSTQIKNTDRFGRCINK